MEASPRAEAVVEGLRGDAATVTVEVGAHVTVCEPSAVPVRVNELDGLDPSG
jgi:hypothetical protein